MSSVEVLYEISDSVSYVIASPFLTYSIDTNYFQSLSYLANNPKATGEEYLRETLEKVGEETNSYFVGVKLEHINELAGPMMEYTAYLLTLFDTKSEEILSGVSTIDSMAYKAIGYRRLEKILINIEKRVNDSKLSSLTQKLLTLIDKLVIARSGHRMKNGHGLSIWLPLVNSLETPTQRIYFHQFLDSYSHLDWDMDTSWADVIKKMAEKKSQN